MFYVDNDNIHEEYEKFDDALMSAFRHTDGQSLLEKPDRFDIGIGGEGYYELIGIVAQNWQGFAKYYGENWHGWENETAPKEIADELRRIQDKIQSHMREYKLKYLEKQRIQPVDSFILENASVKELIISDVD